MIAASSTAGSPSPIHRSTRASPAGKAATSPAPSCATSRSATPEDFPEGLESFAFVTGPACEDVAPIHDRTPAILTLEQGLQWLDLEGPGKVAFDCQPPAGTYTLTHAPRDAVMSREMRRAI